MWYLAMGYSHNAKMLGALDQISAGPRHDSTYACLAKRQIWNYLLTVGRT